MRYAMSGLIMVDKYQRDPITWKYGSVSCFALSLSIWAVLNLTLVDYMTWSVYRTRWLSTDEFINK